MAQERPATPEKQLLNLIENSRLNSVSLQAQAMKHHSLSFLSFGAWVGRISFLRGEFKKWFLQGGKENLNIKLINRLLFLLLLILTFYFVIQLFISALGLNKGKDFEVKIIEEKASSAAFPISSFQKAASYYLEKVRQRDIFSMSYKKKTAEGSAGPREPSARMVEVTQNLKLVGISWSNDPDVIIEDTKALKTFFVKRGGMVGELKVQAIFKDKVVLSYKDEEIELK